MRFVWNSKIVKVLDDYGGGGLKVGVYPLPRVSYNN